MLDGQSLATSLHSLEGERQQCAAYCIKCLSDYSRCKTSVRSDDEQKCGFILNKETVSPDCF